MLRNKNSTSASESSAAPLGVGRIDTSRRSRLPLEEWPHADQTRWLRSKEKRGLFDRDAVLHGLAKPTVRGLEQTMGRFLSYIVNEMGCAPDGSVGTILSPDLVNAYAGVMRERLRAGSVHEELRRLRTGLGILLPDCALDWMNTLPLKPTRAEIVASRKPIDRPDAARALDAAYRAFDAIPATRLDTDSCQAARNCLLVAFCILLDLRRGDLARIRLGEHLRQTGPRWRLMLLADVKNDALLLFDVPPELAKRLEVYLATFRRALLRGRPDHGFSGSAEADDRSSKRRSLRASTSSGGHFLVDH